jgi:hypothetical protein
MYAWADVLNMVVEACVNLDSQIWIPLKTNTVIGGSVNFTDPQWMNHPSHYYRVRWP